MFVCLFVGILFFKSENRERHAEEKDGVLMGYRLLLQVLKLPAVQCYALGILTSKVFVAQISLVHITQSFLSDSFCCDGQCYRVEADRGWFAKGEHCPNGRASPSSSSASSFAH